MSLFYVSADVEDPLESPTKSKKKLNSLLQEINNHRNRQQKEESVVAFSCSRFYDDEDDIHSRGASRSGSFNNQDDFVFLSSANLTLWTDMFIRHFINITDASVKNVAETEDANDDLVFFVKKTTTARLQRRFLPRFTNQIEVYRKDSKKLPIGNVDIDWEETLYLNVILQSFFYTLTLGIVSRTSSSSVQILSKQSIKVYASPSSRCMHEGKGEQEVISFPDIFFTVDNFEDDLLDKLTLKDGESLCIELTARDKKRQDLDSTVLFSGCIPYDPLRNSAEPLLKPKISRMSFKNFTNNYNNNAQSYGRGNLAFVKIRSSSQGMNAEIAVKKNRSESSCPATPTGDQDYDIISLSAYNAFEVSMVSLTFLHAFGYRDLSLTPSYPLFVMAMILVFLQPIVVFQGTLQQIKDLISSCLYFCYCSLLFLPRVVYISCKPRRRPHRAFKRRHDKLIAETFPQDQLQDIKDRRSSDPASTFTDFMEMKSVVKCKSESDLREKEIEASTLNEELSTQQDMWTLPSFGQSFFSWKESKRKSCVPFHVAVTYITMKFDQIIQLLLTNDQKPVLTF